MNERTSSGHEDEAKSLTDYLAAIRRRKWYLILPAVLILTATVAIVYTLPPTYRSTGKILIEQQEIPREWVPASVTSFADERIQAISQRVLTTDNLTRVIEKLDLYTEARREQPIETIVQRMRDSFNIEMIDAKVRDPRTGRTRVATIAFSISFEHHSPSGAQKVANELVSLYLEGNVKSRTQAVTETTRFLEEEAQRLAGRLSDMEARIAAFKKENMGRLPEQQDLNMQLLQRAEDALVETRRQIQSMKDRKTYLESALAQMRNQSAGNVPVNSSDPGTKLESLRARYASLSGIYAEDHPDLVRLRRQIDAMSEGASANGAAAIEAQLEAKRQELASLQERYADGHPDLARVRDEIAALEKQLDGAENTEAAVTEAESPTLVKTRADLNATESELKTLRQQADKYRQMVQSLEQRIAQAPAAEQEYRKLVRDYENVQAKYDDIRAKQSSARVAESLEQERKGERFSLIEPPQLPQKPIKPDRMKLLVLGFAASFVGGLGATLVREEFDHTVRGSRAVINTTDAPVLAVIPRIDTASDQRRTHRNRLLVLAALMLCGAAAVALVHFYYQPLDLLWYQKVLPRLESI